MRSILDIVSAVKESRDATDQELRLALMAVWSMNLMVERQALELSSMIVEGKPIGLCRLRAGFLRQQIAGLFNSRKMDVSRYLGPEWIPGTPEHDKRYALSKKILDKIMDKKEGK